MPRFINLFIGLLIYAIFFRMFSVEFFSKIALGYSIAGITLWLSDFGSSNWMLIQFGKREFDKLRIEWSFRYFRILLVGIFISFFIFIVNKDLALGAITFACLLDLDADTSIGIRQLIHSIKNAVIYHSTKKILQLLLFLSWYILGSSDNYFLFCILLTIPVVFVKIIDTKAIGGLRFKRRNARTENSFPMWLQGGYTSLINLDLVILSYFQEFKLIATLAIGKKLFSALYIFANTLSVDTLGKPDSDSSARNSNYDLVALRQTIFLSIMASILVFTLVNPILIILAPDKYNTLNMSILLLMVAIAPLAIPGSYYNAILLRQNRFISTAMQGYIATFLYLLCIIFIGLVNSFTTGIAVGFLVKTLTEFAIGKAYTSVKYPGI